MCLGVLLITSGLSLTHLYSVESFYISRTLDHGFSLLILQGLLPSAVTVSSSGEMLSQAWYFGSIVDRHACVND